MDNEKPLVYVVEDEVAVSTALARSLTKRGYLVETYISAEKFLPVSYTHLTLPTICSV